MDDSRLADRILQATYTNLPLIQKLSKDQRTTVTQTWHDQIKHAKDDCHQSVARSLYIYQRQHALKILNN